MKPLALACDRDCDMPQRSLQTLLILSTLWVSWLTMTLIHECGHVLGALATGGEVRRVVWHPAVISRTDVHPNPYPLIEICSGPIFGSIAPVLIATVASLLRMRVAYLFWVVSGFCLIANGVYIGMGAIDPIGDAHELVRLGMPRWPMATFGLVAGTSGFVIWHRISPRLGFGVAPTEINKSHLYGTFALGLLMTAVGIVFGDRGM